MTGQSNKINFKNVAEVFDAIDIDKSGGISIDELEKAVVEQGYSVRVAKLLMAELDTNQDSVISYAELQEGLAKSSFVPARPPDSGSWWNTLLIVGYFVVGALVYGYLEGWSPLDSSYFLMVTCTTVGYGDLCPTTRMGKLFTCGCAPRRRHRGRRANCQLSRACAPTPPLRRRSQVRAARHDARRLVARTLCRRALRRHRLRRRRSHVLPRDPRLDPPRRQHARHEPHRR